MNICVQRLMVVILFSAVALAAAADSVSTFTLRGVRSREAYGPFPFRSGAVLKLESGVFQLRMLADNKTFSLVDTQAAGMVYGVYELVLGRMIDIGDVLFVITGVTSPPPAAAPAAVGTALPDDTELGIDFSLVHRTAYKWEINGLAGGDHDMDRRSIRLKARRGVFTVQIGLVTDSEWDHTIVGGEGSFTEAELVSGSGWFAAIGLSVPVFEEGRWSARIHGETFYRREELSLQYGTWEIESITSSVDTNAVTNAVVTVTHLAFKHYDKTAILTETQVSTGVRLAYHAPAWFLYAGLRVLPWSDTTLDAVITSDDRKYKITFERKDPVMVYGGVGLDLFGLRSYIEIEGGGERAVRLGLAREW